MKYSSLFPPSLNLAISLNSERPPFRFIYKKKNNNNNIIRYFFLEENQASIRVSLNHISVMSFNVHYEEAVIEIGML